jgi:thiol-disulfide isomerase/thioredoxin
MKQSFAVKQASIYVAVIVAAAAVGFALQQAMLKGRPASVQSAPPVAASPMPQRLPEFSLVNRAGETQSINSWPGKSLIVNFWATWCGPCRKEIPLLQSIAKARAAEGFQVVGVAVDFRDDVLKYADKMKIEYPILIGEQDGLAAINALGIDPVGFPFTVFTDSQGRIVGTHVGELHADEAKLILDTIRQVNEGKLDFASAKRRLKEG